MADCMAGVDGGGFLKGVVWKVYRKVVVVACVWLLDAVGRTSGLRVVVDGACMAGWYGWLVWYAVKGWMGRRVWRGFAGGMARSGVVECWCGWVDGGFLKGGV